MLEFRILGPLEVVDEHGPVRLGGPKQRATLGILLLNPNRVVSVDRLADDLYAGAAPVTAVTQVQRQISDLRKALGPRSIETRSPGYVIRLSLEQLDLHVFERLTEEASQALARGEAHVAADLLSEALALWRGAPLADLAYDSFAQTAIERLEEIRLAAVEQRIEADLAIGRHGELAGELEQLIVEHPMRERLRAQLMVALYRSGRQAEALDVYQRTRTVLIQEFGIEPTPSLHELQRAVLAQDPSLDLERGAPAVAKTERTLLVVPSDDVSVDQLLTVCEPLGRLAARELIIARLLSHESELESAAASLSMKRGSTVRTAVFTTLEPAADVVRLATAYDVELVLLGAPPELDSSRLPDELAAILEHSPADVAVLSGNAEFADGVGIFVPFGGSQHDWAALELGAWLAFTTNAPLRLVGTKADPHRGQRDASRLLADASLAVQRVVGVEAAPLLAEATEHALLEVVSSATLVVAGVSQRWRQDGIGSVRRALVRAAGTPTLLVHKGPRPGGLAPSGSRTSFTWSIQG